MARKDEHLTINSRTGMIVQQNPVIIMREADIDFVRFVNIYRDGNILVAHSNWLRSAKGIPDSLTIIISGNHLNNVIAEDESAWRTRYSRITSKGYRIDKGIAYVEVKIKDIQEMMGRDK